MDIQAVLLAYAAAALVALGVTASFSASITQTLFRLLPEEAAPHWSRFVKFAVFAASCGGGMLERLPGGFIDRSALPPPPPGAAEGLMLIMNSAIGALMGASWALIIFFAATLTALTAGRVYASVRRRREQEAQEDARRREESRLEKDRSESGPTQRRH